MEVFDYANKYVVCFRFLLECLRWGPTSLQTVKLSISEIYTVCTQLGAENKNLKHTIYFVYTIHLFALSTSLYFSSYCIFLSPVFPNTTDMPKLLQ